MRNKIACLSLILCCSLFTYAQDLSLTAIGIPPELTKDANAVIRENYIEINLEAINEMVVKERRVTTVFNKLGNKHVGAYASYDNDTKITQFIGKSL